jgi:hypothetical protein
MEKPVQEPADSAKQKTRKGYEVPVPKRKDLVKAFSKIIRPPKN